MLSFWDSSIYKPSYHHHKKVRIGLCLNSTNSTDFHSSKKLCNIYIQRALNSKFYLLTVVDNCHTYEVL